MNTQDRIESDTNRVLDALTGGNTNPTQGKLNEQTGYSPGPWTSRVNTDSAARFLEIIGDRGWPIAHVYFGTTQEATANARLIAAAPELLSALVRIMEYAHDGAAIRDINTSEQPEFINARAAIAKAEGKQTNPHFDPKLIERSKQNYELLD